MICVTTSVPPNGPFNPRSVPYDWTAFRVVSGKERGGATDADDCRGNSEETSSVGADGISPSLTVMVFASVNQ